MLQILNVELEGKYISQYFEKKKIVKIISEMNIFS